MIDWMNFKGEKMYVEYDKTEYLPGSHITPPELPEIELLSVTDDEGKNVDLSESEKNEIIDILNYHL